MGFEKSKDASDYWRKIGGTIRYTYGGIITATPSAFQNARWEDLPLGIRSRLSREMNRLQNRYNRQVKPMTTQDREKYRVRWDSAIRRIPPGTHKQVTWDRLYHTDISKPKAKRIRRMISMAPQQESVIQDYNER